MSSLAVVNFFSVGFELYIYACISSLKKRVAAFHRNAGNSVSVCSRRELPEEFYCYIAELSMISSIALATQETFFLLP